MTNKLGEIVTTAVTNMDIHDISRSARTYGMKGYFMVTPLQVQHGMVGRILDHWREEKSREYHPDRFEAVSLVRLVKDFNEVKAAIEAECGAPPEVVMTDARPLPELTTAVRNTYSELRSYMRSPERAQSKRPLVIVFGTGWGIADIFHPEVDRILAPIYGPKDEAEGWGYQTYNHLSVRSAVAIILDRLLGE